MQLIAHHFMKDVRLLRWLLCVWLMFIVVDVIAVCLSVQFDYGQAHAAFKVDSSQMFYVAENICWTLLLVRLVQSEPMAGKASFWRTRPTPPWIMIASKVLFVAFLLILPSVVLHSLSVSLYHLSATDTYDVVKGFMVTDSFIVLLIVWLAAMTRNWAQLLVVGCVLTLAFALLLTQQFPAGDTDLRKSAGSAVFWGGIVISLCLQFGLGKSRAALWLGAACFALSFVIAIRAPFELLRVFDVHHVQPNVNVSMEFDRSVSPVWSKGVLQGMSYDQVTVAVRPSSTENRGVPLAQNWGGEFIPDGGVKTALHNSYDALLQQPAASLNWRPLVEALRPDLEVVATDLHDSQELCLEASGKDPEAIRGRPGVLKLGVSGELQSLQPLGQLAFDGNRFGRIPGRMVWITWTGFVNDLPCVQMEVTGYTHDANDPLGSYVFLMVNPQAKLGIIADQVHGKVQQLSFFGDGQWGLVSGTFRIGCSPTTLNPEAQSRLSGSQLNDWTIEIFKVSPDMTFSSSITVPDLTL